MEMLWRVGYLGWKTRIRDVVLVVDTAVLASEPNSCQAVDHAVCGLQVNYGEGVYTV
jgi:hypothetical protein